MRHGMNIAYNSFNQKRDKGYISHLPDQRRNESKFPQLAAGAKSRKQSNNSSSRGFLDSLIRKGSALKLGKRESLKSKFNGNGNKPKKKFSLLERIKMEKRNKTFYAKTKNEKMRRKEETQDDNL